MRSALSHTVPGAIVGIAPQRIVVAVRLRHLTKRIGIGLPVPRRLRMRLSDPDPSPQPGNGLVGNRPCVGHVWDCILTALPCSHHNLGRPVTNLTYPAPTIGSRASAMSWTEAGSMGEKG